MRSTSLILLDQCDGPAGRDGRVRAEHIDPIEAMRAFTYSANAAATGEPSTSVRTAPRSLTSRATSRSNAGDGIFGSRSVPQLDLYQNHGGGLVADRQASRPRRRRPQPSRAMSSM